MIKGSDKPVPVNYFLEPGYIFLATKPTIISGVVGSCVSVCVYDKKRKTGGMNLFMFPFTGDRQKATAQYGNVSTITLIKMMLERGSEIRHLEAQIIGGAHNTKFSQKDIGRENIIIARKILIKKQVPLVSEDTGGRMGRKIVFNTETSEVAIIKVRQLRGGDWYPYINTR